MKNFKNFGVLCVTNQGLLRHRFLYEPMNSDFVNENEKKETANPDTWEGFFWDFEGLQIVIPLERRTFFGKYINDESGKLLLIFDHLRSKKWPVPHNAVIYNADGTIHKRLSTPELLGRLAQQYKKVDKLVGACFGGLLPGIYKNSKGEEVLGISILFPEQYRNAYGNFFEVREIDLQTGEYGEVLQDGAV